MSKQPPATTIAELFQQIDHATTSGDYIFRGENKTHPKITSTLYRYYVTKIDPEYLDVALVHLVEQEVVKEAKQYAPPDKSNNQILTEIQHYGGATNRIDFTSDYFVALFFACDGELNENGRIILLDRTTIDGKQNREVEPSIENNRVLLQKSVFISPQRGYLLDSEVQIISVAHELKSGILAYLKRCHDIRHATIYKDIWGYIQIQNTHESAYIAFYKGFAQQEKGNLDDAIKFYDEAIKLNPTLVSAYNNRGNTHAALGDLIAALADFAMAIALNPDYADPYINRGATQVRLHAFEEAIKNFDKAIALDPTHAKAFYNRGVAKTGVDEFDAAIEDFDKAITLNPNYAKAFYTRGNTKADLDRLDAAQEDLERAEILAKQQSNAELLKDIQQALKNLLKKVADLLDKPPPK